MIEIKIKTWICDMCGYKQDFEPTKKNMDLHFNQDMSFKVRNIQENECPSCVLKGLRDYQLEREIRDDHLSRIQVLEQSDIDALPENERVGKVVADSKTIEELRTKYEHK